MIETIKQWSGVVALVAILLTWAIPAPDVLNVGATGTRFPNGLSTNTTSPESGEVLTTTLQVGSSGTDINGIKVGSCTVWAGANTIAASSTVQAVCQSATDGTLTSGLTGVTADSICNVNVASSTNTTILGLTVGGVSASSTAGNIVFQLGNQTGTTFTWTAAASSSSQWTYSCFDPE